MNKHTVGREGEMYTMLNDKLRDNWGWLLMSLRVVNWSYRMREAIRLKAEELRVQVALLQAKSRHKKRPGEVMAVELGSSVLPMSEVQQDLQECSPLKKVMVHCVQCS